MPEKLSVFGSPVSLTKFLQLLQSYEKDVLRLGRVHVSRRDGAILTAWLSGKGYDVCVVPVGEHFQKISVEGLSPEHA